MSLKGRVNAYVCEVGHQIVTVDRDDGTTPFMTGCRVEGCNAAAQSKFYRVDQTLTPTHEWYKPGLGEFRRLSPGSAVHVARGGLLLRRIEPVDRSGDPVPDKYPYRADVPDLTPLRRYYSKVAGTWGSYMPAMRDRPGFKRRPKA